MQVLVINTIVVPLLVALLRSKSLTSATVSWDSVSFGSGSFDTWSQLLAGGQWVTQDWYESGGAVTTGLLLVITGFFFEELIKLSPLTFFKR